MADHARIPFRFFDLMLITAILSFAGFWWMFGALDSRDPSWVRIYNAQGLYREVPLKEDGEMRVPGPLGESLVKIRAGEVSMVWSPCPNKLCMHAGAVSRSGENIICVPNRVSVVICSSQSDMDAVSY